MSVKYSFRLNCRRKRDARCRFLDESNVAMATARSQFRRAHALRKHARTCCSNLFFSFFFNVSKRISNVTQKGHGNNLVHQTTRLPKKTTKLYAKVWKSEQLQSIYATQVQYQMSCSDFYIKNNQTRAKARQVNCGYNHDRMC